MTTIVDPTSTQRKEGSGRSYYKGSWDKEGKYSIVHFW